MVTIRRMAALTILEIMVDASGMSVWGFAQAFLVAIWRATVSDSNGCNRFQMILMDTNCNAKVGYRQIGAMPFSNRVDFPHFCRI